MVAPIASRNSKILVKLVRVELQLALQPGVACPVMFLGNKRQSWAYEVVDEERVRPRNSSRAIAGDWDVTLGTL